MLHEKIVEKKQLFSEINDEGYDSIRTFREYDNRYTAPMQGFLDADDYYAKVASLQFLSSIDIPVLVLNAQDDPFLTSSCSPRQIASGSTSLFLETPEYGGHVGFIAFNKDNEYWHETRSVAFVEEVCCGIRCRLK